MQGTPVLKSQPDTQEMDLLLRCALGDLGLEPGFTVSGVRVGSRVSCMCVLQTFT